jgi:D-cysteine desulfhydrase family pyridoxal phosphate-dependent enzyme
MLSLDTLLYRSSAADTLIVAGSAGSMPVQLVQRQLLCTCRYARLGAVYPVRDRIVQPSSPRRSDAVFWRCSMLIGRLPRARLCPLPTPLEELPRFSEALGGPRILMKRDDLTGLAMGGNKARELEFLLGDAVAHDADTIITCGGSQSNHVRMTTAGAAKLGMTAHLVLGPGEHEEMQGNILLDRVLGAEIHWVDTNDLDAQWAKMEAIALELKTAGRRPFIIPRGGASPSGSAAYVNCVLEMSQQLNDMGSGANWLFLASGTGGTQAGLMLGARWMMPQPFRVVGISVSRTSDDMRVRVSHHANEVAALLGAPFDFGPDDVLVHDEYIGQGYGKPTPAGMEATRLMARTEGILLDPVYSAKGVAGMMDLVRRGVVGRDDTVMFLHTGGQPAIFAYDQELIEGLGL